MKELNELVDLATRATQGQWRQDIACDSPWNIEDRNGVQVALVQQRTPIRDNPKQTDRTANAAFISAANPKTILDIAEAYRELEQRAEAAEALNKHLELAVRKAEGVSECLRRRAEDAENKLLFTRPAPAVSLAELVPDEIDDYESINDVDWMTPRTAAQIYWNKCCAAILRNIEEANK